MKKLTSLVLAVVNLLACAGCSQMVLTSHPSTGTVIARDHTSSHCTGRKRKRRCTSSHYDLKLSGSGKKWWQRVSASDYNRCPTRAPWPTCADAR
jgi:hypothetical protein